MEEERNLLKDYERFFNHMDHTGIPEEILPIVKSLGLSIFALGTIWGRNQYIEELIERKIDIYTE
jgi:hypothetical protein